MNRLNRGTLIDRTDPDPLNHYRIIYVYGHGRRIQYKTTDLLTTEQVVAKWDELEAELRKEIGGEDVHAAFAP